MKWPTFKRKTAEQMKDEWEITKTQVLRNAVVGLGLVEQFVEDARASGTLSSTRNVDAQVRDILSMANSVPIEWWLKELERIYR
jgi:hypothetical protein